MIKHFPGCSPDYPEKPDNERPQQTQIVDLGDGTEAIVCVDCGIMSFETAFMPHILLSNGQRLIDVVQSKNLLELLLTFYEKMIG